MSDIRIGKDFNVLWAVYKRVDGQRLPYDLAGKSLQLFVGNDYGKKEVTGWKAKGNVIEWTFLGKDQKDKGAYQLILVENAGKEGMVTVDTCKAFNLVEHSCEENVDGSSDVVIETVTLESEVALAPVVKEGVSYDDTEIKEDLAKLQQNKEDKKNKVTSLSDESTDVQYPSAKTVYDLIKRLEERIVEQDQFIEDLQNTKIEKENDDYYPKMAVGLADNLAGVDVVDSEINFRRSGGGAISDGVARIESIKGNSVVWNQCFAYGRPAANHAWENNRLTLNGTWDASTQVFDTIGGGASFIPPIQGHKSLLCIKHISGRLTSGSIDFFNLMNGTVLAPITPDSSPKEYAAIVVNNNGAYWDYRNISASTSAENLTIEITVYDLTQMFGAGNEPTTIEDFYARIPMGVDLNAYNEGEVIHMDVQSIESQGVNAWDGVLASGRINSSNGEVNTKYRTEAHSPNFIRIMGGASYYAKAANIPGANNYVYLYAYFYDENLAYIGTNGIEGVRNATFGTPTNAKYMRFHLYSTYSMGIPADYKGICINISDSAINGKDFPYIKKVEELGIIRKYFPQGMKSAGSAHDEIRYNKESNKWEKVEAVGVRAYQEGDADNAAYLTDGKVTCYPLAEPIVTELDEADQFKDLDYKVWNAGTEKAIAEGKSAPLAADITYGFNAIGKIKELESLVAALRAKVGI